jgi:hypothetical protein
LSLWGFFHSENLFANNAVSYEKYSCSRLSNAVSGYYSLELATQNRLTAPAA